MSLYTEKAAPGATNTESGKIKSSTKPSTDSITREIENFKNIDEKEILRALLVLGYEYAARDSNGGLYAFQEEPEYSEGQCWAGDAYIRLPAYMLLRLPSGPAGCVSLLDCIRGEWDV